MKRNHCALLAGLAGAALASSATGHGYVGDRFFPPTITTEDPFAVDEFSLSARYFDSPSDDGSAGTDQFSGGIEFDKEIFPRLAVGIEENYFRNHTAGESNQNGFDNFGISVKYELWRNDAHEAIVSIGLDSDIGGTGASNVGESTTTFTPTIYFGKGFGDLAESLWPLKPIAITGSFGQTFATDAEEPNTFETGLALEYSLPYLQQHVKDIGLPSAIRHLIPICELTLETPENRGGGVTTGTVNPGILYESRFFQIGVEALIPVNAESGDHVGVTVNLQLYIDDLLPRVFGQPLLGGQR